MLHLLTLLAGVIVFPWVGLAFLLWMAWMEDTLPEAVRRTGRTPDPAPILAIRVAPEDRPTVADTVDPVDPVQPAGQLATAVPVPRQASLVSRSNEPSLGGSTNR